MTTRNVGDHAVLLVTPPIPDGAPPAVREGLVRRRLCLTEGRCPCGAVPVWPSRAERRAALAGGDVLRVTVVHATGCPATDPRIAHLAGS